VNIEVILLPSSVLTPNVVTNAGLAEVVACAGNGLGGTAFGWIAIGTDSTAADTADTALGAEITTNGGGKDASTVTAEDSGTVTGDVLQLVSGWNFSGSLNIAESGVFNNAVASTGDMLCRQTFTVLAVDNGDSLTITWQITLDQG